MENHPFTSMSYRLKMGDLPFRKLANDQIMSPLCPIKAHENPMKNPIIQITMKIPIKKSPSKNGCPMKITHQNMDQWNHHFWDQPFASPPSHLHQPHLPHQLHPSPPAQCLAAGLHRCPEAAERASGFGRWESAAKGRSLPGSTPKKIHVRRT